MTVDHAKMQTTKTDYLDNPHMPGGFFFFLMTASQYLFVEEFFVDD